MPKKKGAPEPSANQRGLSGLGARTKAPAISWLMDQALLHPHLISLAAGFTDNPSLPVREAKAVLRELLGQDETARAALQYGNTQGDLRLRVSTAARMLKQDETAAGTVEAALYRPEHLLITHGSQQLLYLLTEVLFDPGDIVLVEDPTYFVYLGMAQSHGLRSRGVRMTPEGIDCDDLERVLTGLERSGELPRVKMLYLVSYFQNPSGITTSLRTKARALALLQGFERKAGHPIYLLEDAAYRDLRFAGADVASSLTLKGASRRVIYTSTYSKPFATGIRVGYGWLPPQLLKVVLRVKGNHDFGTAHLLQQLLSRVVASGRLDRHLRSLRKRYRAKANVMGQALRDQCGNLLDWLDPEGGLYYWARLRGRVRSGPRSKLFRAALREDVLYVPGALCYADDSTRPRPDNELRLSFGSAREEYIVAGVNRLARAIQQK